MILVVEDNTVIADNISEYLEIQGVETLIFYNGESAYEYIVEKAKQ
jgi:DNA-binding response OmpR family regulator